MRIAFLTSHMAHSDPRWDTTAHLMHACNGRGHTVYRLQSHDLYVRDSRVRARMHDVTVRAELDLRHYWQEVIRNSAGNDLCFESLADLDAIFLHPSTPLDERIFEYLALIEDRVFIINSITGLCRGTSKLYPLQFPQYIPRTHISRDPQRLRMVIESFGGAVVIKPLQGRNEEGVVKVDHGDWENLDALIHYYVQASRPYHRRKAVMVQEHFEAGRTSGMVRVLLLDGEIIGAMRWMPSHGRFRFNGTVETACAGHVLSPAQAALCHVVRPRLAQDGLYFVGLDLIGDKLVAMDCLVPGGLSHMNQIHGLQLEYRIVDFIERKVREYRDRATTTVSFAFESEKQSRKSFEYRVTEVPRKHDRITADG